MTLTSVLLVLAWLLLIDVLFLLVLMLLVGALAGTRRAAFAVMRRNFVGYFSNPTGYVFLCIFVFLTSLAAFWPYEFFNQNLATLDQLNKWFPLIMLAFIPAITMSIWAEERRQGTDELLLTLPADDFDIVIGKYMSAAAIFTASLLFSQVATFTTLAILTKGQVDIGLICTTYLGYWLVGLVMLAIGMIASFLTRNLTVGFILGALFNAPLAFASLSGALLPSGWAERLLTASGIARPFDDFGRGVISLSSISYFLLVSGVALYVCMVLIGRRHWTGGKDGSTMAWHYLARVIALVLITGGAVGLFRNWDVVRIDATEGRVSSLSKATKQIIRNLDSEQPIIIDAFISDEVPEQYARTRYELVNLLKEFEKSGRNVEVNLHQNIELYSDEAQLAEDRFGIVPVQRVVREKGALQQKRLILGAAIRSGLEKVTIPIFEYGIPVEYELVRSINTVARGQRKRLGIVATDARLMGGNMMSGMSMQEIPRHPLVEELDKQYDVESVDLNSPISPGQYDALVAVQPSSLSPDQFDRLIEAVKAGVPTAIFEDPLPAASGYIPATGEPKQEAGGMMAMMGGGGGEVPKGEIRKLWEALDLEVPGTPSMQGGFHPDLVWQRYNPYPNLPMQVTDLFVFIDDQAPGAENALSDANPITEGLNEVLVLFGGALSAKADSPFTHTPLLTTGEMAGLISYEKARANAQDPYQLMAEAGSPTGPQTVAMAIESAMREGGDDADSDSQPGSQGIKVVYVADTDLMIPDFLQIRADPNQTEEVRFQMQNVTFLLNAFDWLAGEEEYLEVRKHEPSIKSLQLIEDVRNEAKRQETAQAAAFDREIQETRRAEQETRSAKIMQLQEDIQALQRKSREPGVDQAELRRQLQQKVQDFQRRQAIEDRLARVAEEKSELAKQKHRRNIRRDADMQVERIQNLVKGAAVTLPCIPPLLIGIVVFASGRLRERESISKSRLK